ncbi:MAG: metallophosphoesterase [Methanothrix sp.]
MAISDARIKIAVVHQPPRGAQDTLYNGESSGSASLRRFVEEYQPDLLLCGHIHEARGEGFIGSTRIVNVGELRQRFAALIEITDRTTVNWI